MGINYLKETLQNYISFDVQKSIHVSKSVVFGDRDNVDDIIYKGENGEIIISTKEEFNNLSHPSNDILFEITDCSVISLLTDIILEKYNIVSYDEVLSSMIEVLEDSYKLELK